MLWNSHSSFDAHVLSENFDWCIDAIVVLIDEAKTGVIRIDKAGSTCSTIRAALQDTTKDIKKLHDTA
jgi:hypothetical protein